MYNPPKEPAFKERKKTVSLNMPTSYYEAARKAAEACGLSLSEWASKRLFESATQEKSARSQS